MMAPLSQLLGVGDVPSGRTSARRWLDRHGVRVEPGCGRGGKALYDTDTLPAETRAAFEAKAAEAAPAAALEARFLALTEAKRAAATAKAAALRAVAQRKKAGETLKAACAAEAETAGCSPARLEALHGQVCRHGSERMGVAAGGRAQGASAEERGRGAVLLPLRRAGSRDASALPVRQGV